MADTKTDAPASEAASHAGHPTPSLYWQVAGALALLTALETSTYFIDFGFMFVPLLLGLMLIKFVVIVGFFMHLKFDTTLYRKFIWTGIILALFCYVIAYVALAEIPAGVGLS